MGCVLCFFILTISYTFSDISGGLHLQIIDELQRQANYGLKAYESANDDKVRKAGQAHGDLYLRAQAASRAELRAAERIEANFRAHGHNWTSEQISKAVDRMSAHIHTASKIQQAAFELRGKIFQVFNNVDKPKLYNPQRFFRLVKGDGMKWLDHKMFDAQTKAFLPEGWRITAYGSSSKPKTEIRSFSDSLVRQAYSDLYSKGQGSNKAAIKLESIRTTLSSMFSRPVSGPTRTAPGGWMKDSNPMTIGQ